MSGGLRVGGSAIQGGAKPKPAYKRCQKTGKGSKACKAAGDNPWLRFIHQHVELNPEESRTYLLQYFGKNGGGHPEYKKWKKDYEALDAKGKATHKASSHHYAKAKPKVAKIKVAKPK